jgi:hypothetical protein
VWSDAEEGVDEDEEKEDITVDRPEQEDEVCSMKLTHG